MTARDTAVASVKTAILNEYTTGFAGNAAAAPSFGNNTQQYPSLAALKAALSLGQITQSQYAYLVTQTVMQTQVQIQAAKDTLRSTGDVDIF